MIFFLKTDVSKFKYSMYIKTEQRHKDTHRSSPKVSAYQVIAAEYFIQSHQYLHDKGPQHLTTLPLPYKEHTLQMLLVTCSVLGVPCHFIQLSGAKEMGNQYCCMIHRQISQLHNSSPCKSKTKTLNFNNLCKTSCRILITCDNSKEYNHFWTYFSICC